MASDATVAFYYDSLLLRLPMRAFGSGSAELDFIAIFFEHA